MVVRKSTTDSAALQSTPSNTKRSTRTSTTTASATSPNGAASGGDFDYDLFCIGAGSGGVRAARVAAGTYGARVGICEMPYNPIASDNEGGAGGTCVLRGCVPKKLFVYCSEYSESFRDAQGFGWNIPGSPSLNWQTFLEKKNTELKRLNGVYNNLLKNSGVEYIEGRGTIIDPHTVEVAGRRVTAKNIVVATGARAFVPKFEGSDLAIISDNALEVPEVPKSIAIIGAGYIAVEFASIFAGLGAQVHLFYRQPLPLRGFDEEIRSFVTEQYAMHGIQLHPYRVPKSARKLENGQIEFVAASASTAQKEEDLVTLNVDYVMAATGRRPNIHNLGLEAAGVELTDKGAIAVNDISQTSVPSIWAIGDVTNRMELTPVALMEAMALTKTLFGGQRTAPDYKDIATAVFSHPQIGTVGLTEEAAIKEYKNVDVYTSSFRPMKNTISGAQFKTFMKIVVAADSDRVVGIHMAGPEAGEIMQGMGVAVKLGVTKTQLDSVVGIHPTAAEEMVTMRTVTRQIRNGAVLAPASA